MAARVTLQSGTLVDGNELLLEPYVPFTESVRTVMDAVLEAGSDIVTSATASFSASRDEGDPINGIGIPVGTTILTVISATQAQMSAEATLDRTESAIRIGDPARTVTDAVLTMADNTITSATAVFTALRDVGSTVVGVGIPANTTIASVTSETEAELSNPASANVNPATVRIGDRYTARNNGKTRTAYEFLGIKYGTAPVGNDRFNEAELIEEPDVEDGEDAYLATHPRAVPIHQVLINQELVVGRQSNGMVNPFNFLELFGIEQNEDCLYLNVWTPTLNAAANLPVMVWFHGGGFIRNTTTQPQVNGKFYSAKGVVMVTVDYRLMAFGHFYDRSFADEDGRHGSVAILDAIVALRWVQRNIAKFGGNPNNVSIFGESAGGALVGELFLTDAIDDDETLFHKGSMISGGGSGMQQAKLEAMDALDSTEHQEDLFFGRLWRRIPVHNPDDIEEYRGLTVGEMYEQFGRAVTLRHGVTRYQLLNYFGFRQRWNIRMGGARSNKAELRVYPIWDDDIVRYEQRMRGFEAGAQRDVPMMIGGNSKEATVFGLGNTTTTTILNTTRTVGIRSAKDLDALRRLYAADTSVPNLAARNFRKVTDAHMGAGSDVITSTAANFSKIDEGKYAIASQLPAGTVIEEVLAENQIRVSNPAKFGTTSGHLTIQWNGESFGDDVIGDVVFGFPARQIARGHALMKTSKVFYFHQRYTSEGNGNNTPDVQGQCGHGTEVYLLFHALEWGVGLTTGNASDIKLQDIYFSDYYMQAWANFAKHGDPNTAYAYGGDFLLFPTPLSAAWTEYDPDLDNAMVFDNPSFVTSIGMQSNFKREIFEFYREHMEFTMRKTTTSITSAQLKDLVANPVTLVAAPGAGYCIVPSAITLDFKYGAATYAGAADMHIGYGSAVIAESAGSVNLEDFFKLTASAVAAALITGYIDRTDIEDAPLTLENAGADLTTGDGTAVITVYYDVVALH